MNRPVDQLSIDIYSPLHRRPWRVTPRQYRLMVLLFAGRRFRLRELAAEAGYSSSGLYDALESLETGGLLLRRTWRGRLGSSWAKVRAGAHVISNVRPPGRTPIKNPENVRSLLPDIMSWLRPGPAAGPPEPAR